MKPNPEKYQAMVLGRTEDKLLFKSGDIDIRTTEKTNLLEVVLDKIWRSRLVYLSESECSNKRP